MQRQSSRTLKILASILMGFTAQSASAAQRITTEAELPRFSYPVMGTAQQLLESPTAEFLNFAIPVRSDIDKVLAGYDIQDHATRRQNASCAAQRGLDSGRLRPAGAGTHPASARSGRQASGEADKRTGGRGLFASTDRGPKCGIRRLPEVLW